MRDEIPPEWRQFFELQQQADRPRLDDRFWGIDDALDVMLDQMLLRGADCELRPNQVDNLVTNRRKKAARRRALLKRWGGQLGPIGLLDPVATASQDDGLGWTLRSTSSREWEMLVAQAHGQGISAIADHFQMRPGTVKSILSRCKRRLRDCA